ncbi:hypothetical protein BDP27DRAFT_1248574 [Rhodocollybia butyracea]|uniref:Uncharacterized protein n=1 Tax=Rhodocollybia butyracea TaxID=206335 RepID=A0A9P5P1D8_9AGAR|nr:hypothetical protein BDP27DRAFT_1248574 [Rhodocollybia butyracea]
MGRWTQYDEDDYRLPYGFKRIGYDADTGKYTFQDRSGNTWNGAPHQQYGVMHYSGSAAAATIPPMIPSRPASADSLEEPWISVTEEMATPEHDSNPIDPLAFSQEPNRIVRRAKSIAARIRRRPSVPTATDDSPEGGDVESKTTTTRNVGVVRSASMEEKTPTSTSAPVCRKQYLTRILNQNLSVGRAV